MSLRSIFQEMKDEIGNRSRKGLDGLRSRSHRSSSISSAENSRRINPTVMGMSMDVDWLKQSCWSNLPAVLLRDVLVRIEESESSWPPRKDVVACAGVCRSWREIMKEIVKLPELSGQITFPISLKQPGPRDSPMRCFIKLNRTNQTYHLYLGLTPAASILRILSCRAIGLGHGWHCFRLLR